MVAVHGEGVVRPIPSSRYTARRGGSTRWDGGGGGRGGGGVLHVLGVLLLVVVLGQADGVRRHPQMLERHGREGQRRGQARGARSDAQQSSVQRVEGPHGQTGGRHHCGADGAEQGPGGRGQHPVLLQHRLLFC